jgi:hypothetical protein
MTSACVRARAGVLVAANAHLEEMPPCCEILIVERIGASMRALLNPLELEEFILALQTIRKGMGIATKTP